jgi:hypothetical protein
VYQVHDGSTREHQFLDERPSGLRRFERDIHLYLTDGGLVSPLTDQDMESWPYKIPYPVGAEPSELCESFKSRLAIRYEVRGRGVRGHVFVLFGTTFNGRLPRLFLAVWVLFFRLFPRIFERDVQQVDGFVRRYVPFAM